jgi:hypothetical protein
MRNRRIARSLVYAALLFTTVPGCQALYVYRPVQILAQDAETKKPIPGAEVRLSYPLAQSSLAPWESVGTTSSDGLARLQAATYGEVGILLDVTKPGYMTEQQNYPVEAVKEIKPAGLFESVEKRPVSFVVEMYSEPFPAVELVLPDGYRGTVKVAVKIRKDAPCQPGQRLFSYAVPSSGIVHIDGPPLLRRVFSPDCRGRYANGTVLSRQAQGDEIGFWSLKSEGEFDYFVVGTRAEYDELRRADQSDSGESHSSGGKSSGGGRGKRGRGGNQSSGDSGPVSSLSPN